MPMAQKHVAAAMLIAAKAYSTFNVVDETLGSDDGDYKWNAEAYKASLKCAQGGAALAGPCKLGDKDLKKRLYSAYLLKNGARINKMGARAFIRCGDAASVILYLLAKEKLFADCPLYGVMQGDPQKTGHWFVLAGDPTGFTSLGGGDWDTDQKFPTSTKCFTVDLWGANLVADREYLETNADKVKTYADLRAALIKEKPELVHSPGQGFVACEKKELTFWPVWPIPQDQVAAADGWAD